MDSFLKALSVQYFEEISKKILDMFLPKHGFKLLESSETKVIYNNKSDIFLEIYYYPEDIPNYSLMIGIGFIRRNDNSVTYEGAGLWYALPQGYDYKDWKFSNKEGLEKNLTRICNNVFEQYAKPLWGNPNKLRNLIDTQLNESRSNAEKHLRDQSLLKAKQAFKTGKYEEAVKIYDKIGLNNLTTVEQKMYHMGKKHVEKA